MSKRYAIGVLGGGQLGRMSIQAAQRMGLDCLSLDPDPESPASQIADSITAKLEDCEAIADLASKCDAITLENEFIRADAIRQGLSLAGVDESRIVPGLHTLALIQDKFTQRDALARAGLAGPDFTRLDERGTFLDVQLSFPFVIKARFGGYDGKGTAIVSDQAAFEMAQPLWSRGDWMAEAFVPFVRECAVMVAIQKGSAKCFPTMVSVQTNNVCDHVFPHSRDASDTALRAVHAVGGQGLFGVELFELADGSFWINELAPRPHNSGHYTLDWGGITQFEQHVRLVMGLPLEAPSGTFTCMANLLGQSDHDAMGAGIRAALSDPSVRVHLYGKRTSRPGRKMGHINASGEAAVERALAARDRFYRAVIG